MGFMLGGQAIAPASRANIHPDNPGANTKSSWQELIATTPYPAEGFTLIIADPDNFNSFGDALVDIGMGGAGSEVVIVPNLNLNKVIGNGNQVFIPLRIPKGVRLAGRSQLAASATDAIYADIKLVGSGFLSGGRSGQLCTAYGVNTADSGMTGVDPGATPNTKGAWQEIVAATTYPIHYLIVGIGNRNNSAMADADFNLDIAIGAGGSEQIIIADIHLATDGVNETLFPWWVGIPISIPIGSRLAARAECTTADATDRLLDVALYGIG